MFPLLEISKRTPGATQMKICGLELMQNAYKPNMTIGEISVSN